MRSSILILGLTAIFATILQGGEPVKPGPSGRVRIACVGDSITAVGYPTALAKLLGPGYDVKNYGVSGATALKNVASSYWKLGQLELAEAFGPQIVLLMLGTNDSKAENWARKDEFAADYAALIAALKNLSSKPKVYVMIPVPIFGDGYYGLSTAILRDEITPLIRKAAQQSGTETIDLYELMKDSPELFGDKVHPDADGAAKIAKTIYQALTGRTVFVVSGETNMEPDRDIFYRTATVTIRPYGNDPVHYTLDGSEPTAHSPVYKKPIKVTQTTTIKAAAFGKEIEPTVQVTLTKVPLREPLALQPTNLVKGVTYDYYEKFDPDSVDNLATLKPTTSGVVHAVTIFPKTPERIVWGIRWKGYLQVPNDGVYYFYINCNNSGRLWIGDTLVVDNGCRGARPLREASGTIALKAGLHPLEVSFNTGVGYQFDCFWKGPGVPSKDIGYATVFRDATSK